MFLSLRSNLSRSLTVDFILFPSFISFYFTLLFLFLFSIFRTTQVRVYQSHQSQKRWRSHKTDHGTWEKEVEGSGTK